MVCLFRRYVPPQIEKIKLCIIAEDARQVEEAYPDLCNWI